MVQPDKQESKQKWQKVFVDKQKEQGSFIPTEEVRQRISKQIVHAQILGPEGICRKIPTETGFCVLSGSSTFLWYVNLGFFCLKRKIYWKLIHFSQHNHFSNLANTFHCCKVIVKLFRDQFKINKHISGQEIETIIVNNWIHQVI